MSWTILVPLKSAGTRKTRLAPRLDDAARERLALAMFEHVCTVLAGVAGVRVVVLAPTRPAAWRGAWLADAGRGLNAELAAARAALGAARIAVCHADLPLLATDEVRALLAAAAVGVAVAPDRAGLGTNALAIADARAFAFRFGAGSLAAFLADTPDAARIARPGLALDIDTPADLDALAEARAALPN